MNLLGSMSMKKQVVLVAVVLLAELVIAGCAQLGSIPQLIPDRRVFFR